jgi:hypothetical protein
MWGLASGLGWQGAQHITNRNSHTSIFIKATSIFVGAYNENACLKELQVTMVIITVLKYN